MANQKTEAQEELERMFGPEDQFGLNISDRFRLQLVQRQYLKSNLMYRMIFDKWYRPDRYSCIVNSQMKVKNLNEFRTYVSEKYFSFPIKAIDCFRINPLEEKPIIQKQDQETLGQHYLLEKKLLKSYNKIFITENAQYFVAFGTIFYVGGALYFKSMSPWFLYSQVVTGAALASFNQYGRKHRFYDLEEKIKESFGNELKMYTRFFEDQVDELDFGDDEE